jgi:hypothetical protein
MVNEANNPLRHIPILVRSPASFSVHRRYLPATLPKPFPEEAYHSIAHSMR